MNDYPVIHPELTWRLLDGEAVIVSPTSGEIRVLNHVGAEIWQLLVDGNAVEEIEAVLIDQYDLSSQQAHADVSAFLDDLLGCGLITWKSHTQ
jgi:hypothetical protein